MGLLLSVLVVCVGVLEVIACVRHFQDGYLPLWTPHCAVTSGYTNTYERWRSKPSDSFEFRSSHDTSGSLNYTQDQSSENYPQASSSFQNGFTSQRQDHEIEKNRVSSTDHFHERLLEDEIIPSSSVNLIEKDFDLQHIPDTKTSLQSDGSEVKEIPKDVKSVTFDDTISHIPNETYDIFSDIEIHPNILYDAKEKFVPEVETDTKLPQEVEISQFASDVSGKNEGLVSISDLNTEIITKPSDNHEIESHHEIISSTKDLDIESKVPILHSEVGLQEASPGVISVYNLEAESSENFVKDQVTAQEYAVENTEAKISILSADLENVRLSEEKFGETKLNEKPACLIETLHDQSIIAEESESDRLKEEPISLIETLNDQFTITEKLASDRLNEEPISFVETSHDQSITAEKSQSDRLKEEPVSLVETVHDQPIITEESESDRLKEEPIKLVETLHDQSTIAEQSESDRLKEEPVNLVETFETRIDVAEELVCDNQKEPSETFVPAPHISAEQLLQDNYICELPKDVKHQEEVINKQASDTVSYIENEEIFPTSDIKTEETFQPSTPEFSAEDVLNNVTYNDVPVPSDQITSGIQDWQDTKDSVDLEAQSDPSIKLSDTLDSQYSETDVHPNENFETHIEDYGLDSKEQQSSISATETSATPGVIEKDVSSEEISKTSEISGSVTVADKPTAEVCQKIQEDETLPVQVVPEVDQNLLDEEIGAQHISEASIEPRTPSTNFESEKQFTSEGADEDISESRLGFQTTTTDSVNINDNVIDQTSTKSDEVTDIIQRPLETDESDVHTSASPVAPLSIDTSSVSPLEHQSSLSPPKLPSTPKKSKADISWPTFFPGAPVIKRPSVSFATPEAVFTNEDEELLRKYAEEALSAPPCIKKSDDISTTESETTSTSEEKSSETTSTSEKISASDEDQEPVVFREKSPSSIVAGNDFSRKELALQRRKSYKHKRYSSATEIATREEQAEDRSFSENKPGITRASSLKEPRKKFRKPAKASSFEDVLLRDTTAESKERQLTEDSSIPEGKETERADVLREEETSSEGVTGVSDQSDRLGSSAERNEPKKSELRPKDIRTGKDAGGEGDVGDEDCSLSEEQSSSQQTSAPKEAFWLIFSGEYTKAMSKDWHSGHFCCWQCDESLTGQRYVLRDDHPYCIKCYESVFANVCEECNKTIGIDSKDLSYKDKHWHEACFLCNKCRVSLVDKQFGSKADKIYCGNCYDAQFASRCDGCGEIFRAGTKKMEYKTRQWHEKCFCCCVCKTAIGTKSFIPREQEIYCATCYEEKFATRCVKCNKIITSGGVTYKNEPWHRECFTCTHCNTSLAGQRFTSRDEKPYCADCFGELFAKRCTACSKPITGIGGTRFISFEDRHWHNDCFICASCKTSLVGRGFITDADDIICPECAKQKLM